MSLTVQATLLWGGLFFSVVLRVVGGALPRGGLYVAGSLVLAAACCVGALVLWRQHHVPSFLVAAASSGAVLVALALTHSQPAFP